MADTLILNSSGEPLSVLPLSTISWQDAIKFMCLDRVNVLEWYDDWIVSSQSWETRVPAVVMLKGYLRKNNKPRFSKYNVALRDKFRCQYCWEPIQKQEVTMDHVIPTSKGGVTKWTNIVAACKPCNTAKGNRMDWKPLREPHIPTYYELAKIRKDLPFELKHPSWRDYLL